MANKICRCHCNTCGDDREHDEISISSFPELNSERIVVTHEITAVSCRGCKTAAIREKIVKDGSEITQLIYKPQRLWLQQPNWVEKLEEVDNTIYGLLVEVYSAANDDQFRLLSMGVRAALDHVMTYLIGDAGSFERKLDKMVEKKHISENQKDMLLVVIDAGSATAHRGYKPPRDLLEQMIAVMQIIIQQHYITGPMLQSLKLKIPPRPTPVESKPHQK